VLLIALLFLLTLAVLPLPVSAWNIPGHMLSGIIAYQVLGQENPPTIERVKSVQENLQEPKYQGNPAGGTTIMPVEGYGSCSTSPPQNLPSVDFSYAGYRQNNAPVPYGQKPATVSYGEGRHTITSIINLQSGNVLRGAGRDKTILYFPKGLRNLGPRCNKSACYEWDDTGLILAQGLEIGIEDLTIEFPVHLYEHYQGLTNQGFNAISLRSCINCWVKNVTVRNSDIGIFVAKSSDSTIDGAYVYSNAQGAHMHIGISAFSKRIAVTNFKVFGASAHGLTGNWGPDLVVFTNGTRDNTRIEPDHNCNGVGGLRSCAKNFLYSNISGTGSIQGNTGRDGKPLPYPPILWNVNGVDRCPLDVYTEQLKKR
jgi:parallel beta-helix repeat protein